MPTIMQYLSVLTTEISATASYGREDGDHYCADYSEIARQMAFIIAIKVDDLQTNVDVQLLHHHTTRNLIEMSKYYKAEIEGIAMSPYVKTIKHALISWASHFQKIASDYRRSHKLYCCMCGSLVSGDECPTCGAKKTMASPEIWGQ